VVRLAGWLKHCKLSLATVPRFRKTQADTAPRYQTRSRTKRDGVANTAMPQSGRRAITGDMLLDLSNIEPLMCCRLGELATQRVRRDCYDMETFYVGGAACKAWQSVISQEGCGPVTMKFGYEDGDATNTITTSVIIIIIIVVAININIIIIIITIIVIVIVIVIVVVVAVIVHGELIAYSPSSETRLVLHVPSSS